MVFAMPLCRPGLEDEFPLAIFRVGAQQMVESGAT